MRAPALWTIAIMGVISFVIVSFFMLFTLRQFQDSPAGNRAKLAQDVKNKFKFAAVGAYLDKKKEEHTLRIEYQTMTDSGFDQDKMDAEMERVGLFAIEKYTGTVKKEEIREIKVVRHEIHGSGCFQETYSSELLVENPERPHKNPFDFDKDDQ